jgi:hypothetical protein
MIAALASAGLGLASSIYGGIKSAQANKEFESQIDKQESEAEAFFNNRVNRDFMETNAAKSVVEQLRKRYLDQAKQIDSQTAATGGTAEANIAAKGKLNEGFNNVMSNVAQNATGYQENAENSYQNQISDIAKQRMLLAEKKNENATNLMGAGASLLGTAADLGAMEGDKSASGNTIPDLVGLNYIATTEPDKILKGSPLGLGDNLRTKLKTPSSLAQSFFERKSWE